MKTLKTILVAAIALSCGLAANAQSKYGDTPEDSIACLSNVSLYQGFYKEKNYADCYEPWRQILQHCPKFSKTVYQRGATIMQHMINNAANEQERNKYIDELLASYDLRIQYFGEEATVKAMKANMMSTVRPNALKEIYDLYAEAIEIGANKIDENYVTLYFRSAVKYVESGQADPDMVIDCYDIASGLLEGLLEDAVEADDSVKAAKIRVYLASVEADFSPYATCEQLVNIYQKKFDADPKNITLLKKITNIMMKKGCTENQLFFKAAANLYELAPSPATAMMMGTMCMEDKQYGKAIEYLQDATKSLTDKKDLYKAWYYLGIAYGRNNSYSAARTALMKATEYDRTKGDPYLQLAIVYASSYRSIDDGMGGRSAYWAAVDEARHAKNVDPSEATVKNADRLIGMYSGHFPKKNDAFMLDLIDGHGYTVPGWIGRSTIIRTR